MHRTIKNSLVALTVLLFVFIACNKSAGDKTGEPPGGTEISYQSSTDIFANPERGFIRTFGVYSGGTGLTSEELAPLRSQNTSLILRVFYFDQYKNKALDDAELNLVRNDLATVRAAGLKTILRFAYTDDINGTDAPLDIVKQHLDQLKPLLTENEDVIAFMQAGFIGAWGEWHSSSNGLATTENQKQVLDKILEVVPATIMVQVRTPGYKQRMLNTTEPVNNAQAYANTAVARVGHHNDCFLSGDNDYGTYENVAAEKEYVSKEALFVPTGGETCPPVNGFDPNCERSRNEMKLLKWTYLNLDWYPATISAWKASGCFEEFQTYLGYRLALVKANLPATVKAGGNAEISISLTNKGYAPVYNEKKVFLVAKEKTSGTYYDIPLEFDVRTVKPLANIDIEKTVSFAGVPAGTYDLFLRIADRAASLQDKAEYAVRLANKDGWVAEHGGLNRLNHEIIIE